MDKNKNILILKNSGILFFRLLITTGFGLFSSRFIIRSLGVSDYGLYSIVGGIVGLMAFLNTVMTATTYRFIAFEIGRGDKRGANKVFNISLVLHIGIALILLVLTETIGVYYVTNYLQVEEGKIFDALFVLRFSTYASVINILSLPYQGLITAQEKFSIQAIVETIRSASVFAIAVVIVYYTGNKLRMYSILIVFASLSSVLIYIIYGFKKYRNIVRWNFQKQYGKYKEMIGFSGWIMVGAAASVGQSTGINLIINVFYGTVLNAAYGIANQVNSYVQVFSRNLAQAAIPQIIKSFGSGDTDRSVKLTAYTSKYAWFLMAIPALPILLETKFLLNIWLGDIPQYTVIFCQLMIINALISGLGNGLNNLVQATGKIKYFQIILSGTSLLLLPISYLLLNIEYPPYSIFVVFILLSSINVILWQILLRKVINFNTVFFLKTSYLRILYFAILIIPLFLIRDLFLSTFVRFIIISISSLIWSFLTIYFIGLERRERVLMMDLLFSKLNSITIIQKFKTIKRFQ